MALLPEKIQWWQLFTQAWKFTTLLRYHRATLQQIFDECKVGPEAQAVLTANSGYFMCPPDELSLLAYHGLFSGFNRGAYAPRKPFRHMTDRFEKFITSQHDCHIYYQSEVTRVHTSGTSVDAVVTGDGRRFTAPTILWNGDSQKMAEASAYRKPVDEEESLTAVTCCLEVQGIDLRDYGFGRHHTWHLEQWDMNRAWDEAMGGDWSRPWMLMATPSLDAQGRAIEKTWQFEVKPQAQVHDVTHTGAKDLFEGDLLRVAFQSTAKGKARFQVGDWAPIPMRESEPGYYVGEYRVKPTDSAIAKPLKVHYQLGDHKETVQAKEPVRIFGGLYRVRVESPMDGAQVDQNFHLAGHARWDLIPTARPRTQPEALNWAVFPRRWIPTATSSWTMVCRCSYRE